MAEDTNITKELTKEVEQLDNVLQMENDLYDSESYSEDDDEEQLIVDISYYESSPSPSSHSLSLSIGIGNDDSDLVPEEKSPFGLPFKNEGKSKKALAEEALLLNKKLQVNFIEHIHKIKAALKDNETKLAQLDKTETEAPKNKLTAGTSLRVPYFRKGFSVPEPNEDSKAKKLSKDYDIIVSESAKDPRFYFRKSSRDILKKAVIENCKQTLLAPLLSKMEHELEKLNKCQSDLEELPCEIENIKSQRNYLQPAESHEDFTQSKKLMKDIEAIEKKIEKKREELTELRKNIAQLEKEINKKKLVTDEEILNLVDAKKIDWMKISRMNFKGNTNDVDCQKAWENQVSPRLNTGSWSPKEESTLKKLVASAPSGEWQKIAIDLGTGRTAWQCFTHYQRHLNQDLESRPWTKDEEANLIRITQIIKDQFGHYRWTQVASLMDCRSPKECMMKYSKVNPKQSHGRWSKSEDAKLRTAYETFGPSWSKVANKVETRNAVQCRDRYCHSLAPNIKYRRFSYDDDARLLKLYKEIGPAWSKMVKHFEGRTDSMLLGRYRTLQKWKDKTHWFEQQSSEIKNLLLGKSLKSEERNSLMAQLKEYLKTSLGVEMSDYRRQIEDKEQNIDPNLIPPRPPLHLKFFHKPKESRIDIKHWCQKLSRNKRHIERLQKSLRQRTLVNSPSELLLQEDGLEETEKSSQRTQEVSKGDTNTKHMEMVLNKLFLKQGQMNVQEIVKLAQDCQPKPKSELRLHHNINKELRNLLCTKMRRRTTKLGRTRRYFERETRPNSIVQAEVEQVKHTVPAILMKSLGTDVNRLYNEARWKRLQCLLTMRDLNSKPIEDDPDYRREVDRLNGELEKLAAGQEKDSPDTVTRRNLLERKKKVIKSLFSKKLDETLKDLESCVDITTNDIEYLNKVLCKRNTTEADSYPDVPIANVSQDDQCPLEPLQEESTAPLVDSSFSGKKNVVNALKKLKCSMLSPTKGNRPERRLSDEAEKKRHDVWTGEKIAEESKSLQDCAPLNLEDLPLLAPNATTVRCLKRLLLKERELSKKAGKLRSPEGGAGHVAEVATQAADGSETPGSSASESDSMEEEDDDDCQLLPNPRPYFIQPVVTLTEDQRETARTRRLPSREGQSETAKTSLLPSTEGQRETARTCRLPSREGQSETAKTSRLPSTEGHRETARTSRLPSTEGQRETARTRRLPSTEGQRETARTSRLSSTDVPDQLPPGVKNKVICKISKDGSHLEITAVTARDEVPAPPIPTEQPSIDQVKKSLPDTLEAESILSQLRQNDEYKNLLARFRALFMWPLFLSATQMSDSPMSAQSNAQPSGSSVSAESNTQPSGSSVSAESNAQPSGCSVSAESNDQPSGCSVSAGSNVQSSGCSVSAESTAQLIGSFVSDLSSKLSLYVKSQVEERKKNIMVKWNSTQSQQIPSNSNDSTLNSSHTKRKRKRGRPPGHGKEASKKKKLEETQPREEASSVTVEIQEVVRDIKVEIVEQPDEDPKTEEVNSKRRRGRPKGSKKKNVGKVRIERPRRNVCTKQIPEVNEDTKDVCRQLPQWWRDAILAAMLSKKALKESQEEDEPVDIAEDEDFYCKGNYSDDEWAVQSKTWT